MSLHIDPRLSQVLPIIRCSDCGQDVLFRKLSEHICISAPAMPVLPLSLSTPNSDSTSTESTDTVTTHITPSRPSFTINTSPLSPIRSASVRSRPALPFLEKYSKRKSASAPALVSQSNVEGQQSNPNRNSQQKNTISPIIAAALSDNDQDLLTPRPSIDERPSPLISGRYTPDLDQDKRLLMETVCNYPVRPARMSQQLPVVPRKSAARTSGIAPRRGLGITSDSDKQTVLTTDARSKFAEDQEREREWVKSNRSTLSSTPSSYNPITSIEVTRSNSMESMSSSASISERDNSFERSNSRLGLDPLRPERPKRNNDLRFGHSGSPSGESSPRSSTSVFTTPSPPLSVHDELQELEMMNESQEILYRPPTPDSTSSSSSPILKGLPFEKTIDEESLETEPVRKTNVDQFEIMVKDLVQEIKSKVIPVSRRDSSRPIRKQVAETTKPEPKRITSPTPVPIPSQPDIVRRADNLRNSPSISPKSTEQKTLCRADDTRKRPQSPIPARPNVASKEEGLLLPTPSPLRPGRRSEDIRKSPSPVPSFQSRPARQSADNRNSPSPVPPQPRAARRSEDVRKSPSPVPPPQPRVERQSADSRSPSSSTSTQTRTARQERATSPISDRSKATYRTNITEQRRVTSPIPDRSKAAYRTDIVESTPLSPSLRPKVTRETNRSERVESTPLSPTLRPKVTRENNRTTGSESTTPLSPSLRPQVAREDNRIESIRSSPLSPSLRPKVVRETCRTDNVESPRSPPLRPRTTREVEATAVKSAPLSSLSRPRARETYRNDVAESAPISPPLRPRVIREDDVNESSPLSRLQTRLHRQVEDLQRPSSPLLQPRTVHRSADSESRSPSPAQPRDTRQSEGILPSSVMPKRIFRQSEGSRNPSPPAPESQPMVSRRSDEIPSQRNVRENNERTGKTSRPSIRGDKFESSEKSKKKVHYDEDHSEAEHEHPDCSFEHEHGQEPNIRSESIGKTDKKELQRSATAPTTTRKRTKNGRAGFERCANCNEDILPSELADSIKMAYGSYHAECMKCTQCGCFIPSSLDAHEFEGRLLCEKDFAKMLQSETSRPQRRKICTGCESPIETTEQTVYALGKPWHEHHLFCYHCIKPIRDAHVEKNGRVYCVKDFNELFLPKCNACGLIIEGNSVSTKGSKMNGKWHPGCFRCTTCMKEFPENKFYVFKDQPYCKRHYHRKNNSMCMRCDEPIEGQCAQTMEGWRFHPKCFLCSECGKRLKENYYSHDGQTYCEKDMMSIQRSRNVRAQRCNTVYGDV
ncbi:hypothetical protein BGZ46_008162 [Entomortierella lignicola]|nr:hypothetical protein BGZ46_008162 [Entomortierella lignicola]